MHELLLWAYLVNSVLLIVHEIDSAYWKEWKLFNLPGGITGFLLMHIPLVFFILYGLVLLSVQDSLGIIFSMVLALGGLFAFSAHTYFIKRGRKEFNNPVSISLLVAILLVSTLQLVLSVK